MISIQRKSSLSEKWICDMNISRVDFEWRNRWEITDNREEHRLIDWVLLCWRLSDISTILIIRSVNVIFLHHQLRLRDVSVSVIKSTSTIKDLLTFHWTQIPPKFFDWNSSLLWTLTFFVLFSFVAWNMTIPNPRQILLLSTELK